ncbi:hypothetical protein PBI_VALIDUS_78 [Mycobacterium phage Validus]|uniref:Uncharacterized protein n=1 Tax=Mycobacterium phage Validus TaxID=1414747 RepID=V5UQW5_9CAUD|nr:hypothetical protein CC50_gp033 [Mycobacterium phage Validus]AHB79608.1 hypothetical protein PBI_VALIDUS_78 [Mycobacterium phage Validus]
MSLPTEADLQDSYTSEVVQGRVPAVSYYGSPRPVAPSELDVSTTPSAPEPVGRCLHCARPAQPFLCWSCVGMLRRQLVEVPWLLRRLHESAYGEAKVAKRGLRVSTGERLPSLPLNMRAADMLRDAARLVRWAEQVLDLDAAHGAQSDAAEHAARYLAAEPGRMMMHPWAPDALRWVLQWRSDAERVIDLPPDTQYAGPCQNVVEQSRLSPAGALVPPRVCEAPLYVDAEAVVVDCHRCGCRWDVSTLQRQALDRVDEAQPRTAAEMWRLLKLVGRDVPRSSFYKLMTEVEAHGYRDGLPVYTYTAVVAALDARDAADAARRAAGKAKRGRPRKTASVDGQTTVVDTQTGEAVPSSAPQQVTG